MASSQNSICKNPNLRRGSSRIRLMPSVDIRLNHSDQITKLDLDLNITTTADLKAIVNARLEAELHTGIFHILRSDFPITVSSLSYSGNVLLDEKTLASSGLSGESIVDMEHSSFLSTREKTRLHYMPEARTRYISKAKRRADRARRAERNANVGTEYQFSGAESAGNSTMSAETKGTSLADLKEMQDRGEDDIQNMDDSESDWKMDKGTAVNGCPDEETREAFEADVEVGAPGNLVPNSPGDANRQESGNLVEQDMEEAQPEGFTIEIPDGPLEEVLHLDPFVTTDQDKENWDPQIIPNHFVWQREGSEETTELENLSMSDDELDSRTDILLMGSSLSVSDL